MAQMDLTEKKTNWQLRKRSFTGQYL